MHKWLLSVFCFVSFLSFFIWWGGGAIPSDVQWLFLTVGTVLLILLKDHMGSRGSNHARQSQCCIVSPTLASCVLENYQDQVSSSYFFILFLFLSDTRECSRAMLRVDPGSTGGTIWFWTSNPDCLPI